MRLLVIGGSGFIGPFVVRDLASSGHQVALFHRGHATPVLPDGVGRIIGDRGALADSIAAFRRFAPDVVVDCILSSERQALALMDAFRGLAARVVALSSGDVYRAAGILHGVEPGPLQPMPLTEDSERRTHRNPYGPEVLERLRNVFEWLDAEYDKIPVEDAVLGDPSLPGTVLRLPMVYGAGDPLHRLYPHIKRMDDRRPAILLQEDAAGWRGPRGYVENVAAAIALAATSPQAAGRVYNVAEQPALSETQWAQAIGRVLGWNGPVQAVPKELTPAHLRLPFNSAQEWIMNSDRIRKELGFADAVPLEIALERTIEWERANPPANIDPKQFDYTAEDDTLEALQLTK